MKKYKKRKYLSVIQIYMTSLDNDVNVEILWKNTRIDYSLYFIQTLMDLSIWLGAGRFFFHFIQSPPCCWKNASVFFSSILHVTAHCHNQQRRFFFVLVVSLSKRFWNWTRHSDYTKIYQSLFRLSVDVDESRLPQEIVSMISCHADLSWFKLNPQSLKIALVSQNIFPALALFNADLSISST